MQSRFVRQLDLVDCVLEDRILMDGSQPGEASPRQAPTVAPMILTTSGFVILPTTSVAFSSFGGTTGTTGGNGNYGLNMASDFYITGFGLSVMTIGNASGDPTLGPVGQPGLGTGVNANVNVSPTMNPGANQAGGAAIPAPNPAGRNIPLNPGSGFRFIGQTGGFGVLGGSSTNPSQNQPPSIQPPFAPLAPTNPMDPDAPTQSEQADPSAALTPGGPSFETPSGDHVPLLDTPSIAPGNGVRSMGQADSLGAIGDSKTDSSDDQRPRILLPLAPLDMMDPIDLDCLFHKSYAAMLFCGRG